MGGSRKDPYSPHTGEINNTLSPPLQTSCANLSQFLSPLFPFSANFSPPPPLWMVDISSVRVWGMDHFWNDPTVGVVVKVRIGFWTNWRLKCFVMSICC